MKKKQLRVMMRVILMKIQINCFSFVRSVVLRDGFLTLGSVFVMLIVILSPILSISSIFPIHLVDISKGVRIYHALASG